MQKLILLSLSLSLISLPSWAFTANEVIAAGNVKRNLYVADSTITGGDALANPVTLSAIRWASNPGFERIVIDLSGEGSGWENKTPPYFQVGSSSKEQKISLSIRGVAARKLSQSSLNQALVKSKTINSAYLAPGLEGDLAAMEFRTRAPADIESFYLTSPPRIVIDVRTKQ